MIKSFEEFWAERGLPAIEDVAKDDAVSVADSWFREQNAQIAANPDLYEDGLADGLEVGYFELRSQLAGGLGDDVTDEDVEEIYSEFHRTLREDRELTEDDAQALPDFLEEEDAPEGLRSDAARLASLLRIRDRFVDGVPQTTQQEIDALTQQITAAAESGQIDVDRLRLFGVDNGYFDAANVEGRLVLGKERSSMNPEMLAKTLYELDGPGVNEVVKADYISRLRPQAGFTAKGTPHRVERYQDWAQAALSANMEWIEETGRPIGNDIIQTKEFIRKGKSHGGDRSVEIPGVGKLSYSIDEEGRVVVPDDAVGDGLKAFDRNGGPSNAIQVAIDELGLSEEEFLDFAPDFFLSSFEGDEDGAPKARVLSTGELQVDPKLALRPAEWDAAVDATDASPIVKENTKRMRRGLLNAQAEQFVEVASRADNDFVDFYEQAKASGKKDPEILEEFFSDPDNFSLLENFGASLLHGTVDAVAGLALSGLTLAGNDWAREQYVSMMESQEADAEMRRLFGRDSRAARWTGGLLQAAPALVTDIGIGIATGGLSSAAAVGRNAARWGVKSTLRQAMRQQTRNAIMEAIEKKAKTGTVLKMIEDDIRKSVVGRGTATVAALAGYRVAPTTYVGVYSSLVEDGVPEDEARSKALGAATLDALKTSALVAAFNAFGKGGAESLVIAASKGNLTLGQLGRIAEKVRTGVAKQAGDDTLKVLGEVLKKEYRSVLTGLGKAVLDEATEEALDEGISTLINNIATNPGQPFEGITDAVIDAAVIGGALGGGAKLAAQPRRRLDRTTAQSAAQSILNQTAARLEEAGDVQTAAVLRGKASFISSRPRTPATSDDAALLQEAEALAQQGAQDAGVQSDRITGVQPTQVSVQGTAPTRQPRQPVGLPGAAAPETRTTVARDTPTGPPRPQPAVAPRGTRRPQGDRAPRPDTRNRTREPERPPRFYADTDGVTYVAGNAEYTLPDEVDVEYDADGDPVRAIGVFTNKATGRPVVMEVRDPRAIAELERSTSVVPVDPSEEPNVPTDAELRQARTQIATATENAITVGLGKLSNDTLDIIDLFEIGNGLVETRITDKNGATRRTARRASKTPEWRRAVNEVSNEALLNAVAEVDEAITTLQSRTNVPPDEVAALLTELNSIAQTLESEFERRARQTPQPIEAGLEDSPEGGPEGQADLGGGALEARGGPDLTDMIGQRTRRSRAGKKAAAARKAKIRKQVKDSEEPPKKEEKPKPPKPPKPPKEEKPPAPPKEEKPPAPPKEEKPPAPPKDEKPSAAKWGTFVKLPSGVRVPLENAEALLERARKRTDPGTYPPGSKVVNKLVAEAKQEVEALEAAIAEAKARRDANGNAAISTPSGNVQVNEDTVVDTKTAKDLAKKARKRANKDAFEGLPEEVKEEQAEKAEQEANDLEAAADETPETPDAEPEVEGPPVVVDEGTGLFTVDLSDSPVEIAEGEILAFTERRKGTYVIRYQNPDVDLVDIEVARRKQARVKAILVDDPTQTRALNDQLVRDIFGDEVGDDLIAFIERLNSDEWAPDGRVSNTTDEQAWRRSRALIEILSPDSLTAFDRLRAPEEFKPAPAPDAETPQPEPQADEEPAEAADTELPAEEAEAPDRAEPVDTGFQVAYASITLPKTKGGKVVDRPRNLTLMVDATGMTREDVTDLAKRYGQEKFGQRVTVSNIDFVAEPDGRPVTFTELAPRVTRQRMFSFRVRESEDSPEDGSKRVIVQAPNLRTAQKRAAGIAKTEWGWQTPWVTNTGFGSVEEQLQEGVRVTNPPTREAAGEPPTVVTTSNTLIPRDRIRVPKFLDNGDPLRPEDREAFLNAVESAMLPTEEKLKAILTSKSRPYTASVGRAITEEVRRFFPVTEAPVKKGRKKSDEVWSDGKLKGKFVKGLKKSKDNWEWVAAITTDEGSYGFWTNDPDYTAQQVDAGLTVLVPEQDVRGGKIHPGITVVEQDGAYWVTAAEHPRYGMISEQGELSGKREGDPVVTRNKEIQTKGRFDAPTTYEATDYDQHTFAKPMPTRLSTLLAYAEPNEGGEGGKRTTLLNLLGKADGKLRLSENLSEDAEAITKSMSTKDRKALTAALKAEGTTLERFLIEYVYPEAVISKRGERIARDEKVVNSFSPARSRNAALSLFWRYFYDLQIAQDIADAKTREAELKVMRAVVPTEPVQRKAFLETLVKKHQKKGQPILKERELLLAEVDWLKNSENSTPQTNYQIIRRAVGAVNKKKIGDPRIVSTDADDDTLAAFWANASIYESDERSRRQQKYSNPTTVEDLVDNLEFVEEARALAETLGLKNELRKDMTLAGLLRAVQGRMLEATISGASPDQIERAQRFVDTYRSAIPNVDSFYSQASDVTADVRAANLDAMQRLGLVDGDTESVVRAVRKLTGSLRADEKGLAPIAEALLNHLPRIRNARFAVIDDPSNDKAGIWAPGVEQDTIILNLARTNGRGLGDALLHELVHHVTVDRIRNPRTEADRQAVAEIDRLRRQAAAFLEEHGLLGENKQFAAAVASNEEFLTYALTSRGMQALLNKVRPGSDTQKRGLLGRLFDAVWKLLTGKSRTSTQPDWMRDLLDFVGRDGHVIEPPYRATPEPGLTDGGPRATLTNATDEGRQDNLPGTQGYEGAIAPAPGEAATNRRRAIQEAVDLLRGVHRANPATQEAGAGRGGERVEQLRKAEAAALRRYAERQGSLVDGGVFAQEWQNRGEHRGSEHLVYLSPEEGMVYKRNTLTHHATVLDYLEHLAYLNELFPDTGYEIVEWSDQLNGLVVPVVRQPVVRIAHPSTEADVQEFMENIGFVKFQNSYYLPDDNYLIWDLHYENAVIDEDGNLAVIDALSGVRGRGGGDPSSLLFPETYVGARDFLPDATLDSLDRALEAGNLELPASIFLERTMTQAARGQVDPYINAFLFENPDASDTVANFLDHAAALESGHPDFDARSAVRVDRLFHFADRVRNGNPDGLAPYASISVDPNTDEQAAIDAVVKGPPALGELEVDAPIFDNGGNFKRWFRRAGKNDPRFVRMVDDQLAIKRSAETFLRSWEKRVKRALNNVGEQRKEAVLAEFNAALGDTAPALTRDQRVDAEKEMRAKIRSAKASFRNRIRAAKTRPAEERRSRVKAAQDTLKADYMRAIDEKNQTLARAAATRNTIARGRVNRALNELPSDLRELAVEMRGEIDKWSSMLSTIPGAINDRLRAVIGNNLGVYLKRSYRIFDDPGWAKLVLDDPGMADVKQAAIEWFRDELVQERARKLGSLDEYADLTEDERLDVAKAQTTEREAEARFQDFINKHSKAGAGADFYGGKFLGSENADSLLRKGDVPEVLRKAMGEYEDGRVNAARTVLNLSALTSSKQFFNQLLEVAEAENLIVSREEWESNPGRYRHYEPISESNESLRPLAGKYMHKDMYDAFNESVHKLSDVGRVFTTMTGLTMAMKTVWSPFTWVRNSLGNIFFFGPAQGWMPFGRLISDYEGFRDDWRRTVQNFSSTAEGADLEAIRYMQELGVLDDNVHVGLMTDMLRTGDRQFFEDVALPGSVEPDTYTAKLRKHLSKFSAFNGRLGDGYQAVDNVHKLGVFARERAVIEQAYGDTWTKEQIDREAARKVRMTQQAYSQAPEIIRKLKSSGLGAFVAPFVTFSSEVIRISTNTIKLATEEINSGNSVIRNRGIARLAGFLTVQASMMTPLLLTALGMGFSDDEEEAIRSALPEWARNKNYLMLRNADGSVTTLDFSYINPFSMLGDLLPNTIRSVRDVNNADATLGDLAVRMAIGSARSIIEPFANEQILTGAIVDTVSNSNSARGGLPIYLDEDDPHTKAIKSMGHILRTAQPGGVSTLRNFHRAVTGYQSVTGKDYTVSNELLGAAIKVATLDVEDLAANASRRYATALRQNRGLRNGFTTKSSYQGDARSSYLDYDREQLRVARKLGQVFQGLRELGVPPGRIKKIANENNLSRELVTDSLRGVYRRYTPDWAEIRRNARDVDPDGGDRRIQELRDAWRLTPTIRTLD